MNWHTSLDWPYIYKLLTESVVRADSPVHKKSISEIITQLTGCFVEMRVSSKGTIVMVIVEPVWDFEKVVHFTK